MREEEEICLTPNPSPNGEGSSMWSYPYWAACILRKGFSLTLESSFSHRTHRFNRTHLRTISIPQNASGIQSSQRPFN